MTLYEINNDLRLAFENIEIDEETGEISAECLKRIEEIKLSRLEKLEAYGIKAKEFYYQIEALKDEKKRLEDNIRKINKVVEYLTNTLSNELDGEPLQTSKVDIRFRKSTRVEIEDESTIPKKFQIIKATPNKTEIKKALQQGTKVKGCSLVDSRNINIK